jgi:hypothetical protein
MEKVSWTERVKNEEVLLNVKEDKSVVHTVKRRKSNWFGHILRRNCFLRHVTEGKIGGRIGVMMRRGRRR